MTLYAPVVKALVILVAVAFAIRLAWLLLEPALLPLTVLALLADGEAWSSSALAIALGASPRTVQRALEQLAEAGQAQSFGRGRAQRWTVPSVPGFPTVLLLPNVASDG